MNILQLKKIWYETAKKNQWIKNAWDPPFTETSIHMCNSIEDLKSNISHGNWCLGQGFALADPFNPDRHICFVNQIDGGDEWLTIKYDRAFESYTLLPSIKRVPGYSNDHTFEEIISALIAAPLEECVNLNYLKYINC